MMRHRSRVVADPTYSEVDQSRLAVQSAPLGFLLLNETCGLGERSRSGYFAPLAKMPHLDLVLAPTGALDRAGSCVRNSECSCACSWHRIGRVPAPIADRRWSEDVA